jgi:hypothetical protein
MWSFIRLIQNKFVFKICVFVDALLRQIEPDILT